MFTLDLDEISADDHRSFGFQLPTVLFRRALDIAVTFGLRFAVDGAFGFCDGFAYPAQSAPGPVVAAPVVNDPIRDAVGLPGAAGRPRPAPHQPGGDPLVEVFATAYPDRIGWRRNAGAQNE